MPIIDSVKSEIQHLTELGGMKRAFSWMESLFMYVYLAFSIPLESLGVLSEDSYFSPTYWKNFINEQGGFFYTFDPKTGKIKSVQKYTGDNKLTDEDRQKLRQLSQASLNKLRRTGKLQAGSGKISETGDYRVDVAKGGWQGANPIRSVSTKVFMGIVLTFLVYYFQDVLWLPIKVVRNQFKNVRQTFGGGSGTTIRR